MILKLPGLALRFLPLRVGRDLRWFGAAMGSGAIHVVDVRVLHGVGLCAAVVGLHRVDVSSDIWQRNDVLPPHAASESADRLGAGKGTSGLGLGRAMRRLKLRGALQSWGPLRIRLR